MTCERYASLATKISSLSLENAQIDLRAIKLRSDGKRTVQMETKEIVINVLRRETIQGGLSRLIDFKFKIYEFKSWTFYSFLRAPISVPVLKNFRFPSVYGAH